MPETPRLAWGLGDRYAPVSWSASRSGGQAVRGGQVGPRWANQPIRSHPAQHGAGGRERVAISRSS
jgi:hypothetical protein